MANIAYSNIMSNLRATLKGIPTANPPALPPRIETYEEENERSDECNCIIPIILPNGGRKHFRASYKVGNLNSSISVDRHPLPTLYVTLSSRASKVAKLVLRLHPEDSPHGKWLNEDEMQQYARDVVHQSHPKALDGGNVLALLDIADGLTWEDRNHLGPYRSDVGLLKWHTGRQALVSREDIRRASQGLGSREDFQRASQVRRPLRGEATPTPSLSAPQTRTPVVQTPQAAQNMASWPGMRQGHSGNAIPPSNPPHPGFTVAGMVEAAVQAQDMVHWAEMPQVHNAVVPDFTPQWDYGVPVMMENPGFAPHQADFEIGLWAEHAQNFGASTMPEMPMPAQGIIPQAQLPLHQRGNAVIPGHHFPLANAVMPPPVEGMISHAQMQWNQGGNAMVPGYPFQWGNAPVDTAEVYATAQGMDPQVNMAQGQCVYPFGGAEMGAEMETEMEAETADPAFMDEVEGWEL